MAKVEAVKTVRRAIEVLNAVADANGQIGVIELSERLRASQSTVHRILSTLATEDYVVQNPHTGKYGLGLQVIALAGAAMNQLEIRKQAVSTLERVALTTECNANLAILYRDEAFYVARVEGPKTARTYSQIGRRAPAHATALGKAILAFLPEEEVEVILARRGLRACTRQTITDPDALREELARTRARGYATDSEEFIEGVRCVAVPIRGADGKVQGAISVSGSVFQCRPEDVERLAGLLFDAAFEISSRLGYTA